jgi:LysM repeat protein/3D (Asp-Asp-Asp) domain-containing protein
VRSIAESYRVSTEAVLAANTIEDPDLLHVGQQLVVPSLDGTLHMVSPGETLRAIADDYGVDLPDLITTNALGASPDLVAVGTVLVVPGARSPAMRAAGSVSQASNIQRAAGVTSASPPQVTGGGPRAVEDAPGTYTVRQGDSLRSVAEALKLDLLSLIDRNGLADPDRIGVGTILVVPPGRSPSQPPPMPPAPSRPVQQSEAPAPVSPTADRVIAARVTGYALGAGAVSTRTASGTTAHWGTVAADTHLYPLGRRIRIEGLEDMTFVVDDTGGAVRGNVFDVWFPDAASARRLGARTRQVTILTPGHQ